MTKKKTALSKEAALDAVRRLMRSTGFDEEEVYGGEANQLHFASRDEGDRQNAHDTVKLTRDEHYMVKTDPKLYKD